MDQSHRVRPVDTMVYDIRGRGHFPVEGQGKAKEEVAL